MKYNEDGSATIEDKYDWFALFELGSGKWNDKQINDMRKRITRTFLHIRSSNPNVRDMTSGELEIFKKFLEVDK